METLELHVVIEPRNPWAEILMSQLADVGFDAFEETKEGINAYGPADQIDLNTAMEKTLIGEEQRNIHDKAYKVRVTQKKTPYQNWNETWEADFQPVKVDTRLAILAPFHSKENEKGLIIEIQPRMSFGTGHHQTTWMMAKAMLDIPEMPKTVLDMGTGTGVLAILAEKLGAKTILAIDIEDWSVENTEENVERNNCHSIRSLCGEVEQIGELPFELIVANINKNVLKKQVSYYARVQEKGSRLFLSGFFESDTEEVIAFTELNEYKHAETLTKETWAMLSFVKK